MKSSEDMIHTVVNAIIAQRGLKNSVLQRGLNLRLRDTGATLWPNELWSHKWRDLVICGLLWSRVLTRHIVISFICDVFNFFHKTLKKIQLVAIKPRKVSLTSVLVQKLVCYFLNMDSCQGNFVIFFHLHCQRKLLNENEALEVGSMRT